ncbi:MAG: glycoside hydrolase family 2 protein [Anaerolineae bacterium]|jgi:beta-mannosidase
MNSNDTMNLSGAWKMADFDPGQGEPAGAAGPGFDDGEWLPATVPGDVHTSLLTLGEIPDPFYDYNVEQVQWVEKREWWFRKRFPADSEPESEETRDFLVFDGLDLFATIYLNGEKLGEHTNMFRPAEFDVTGRLRWNQDNVIAVRFDPLRARVGEQKVPGQLPNYDADTRTFVRKAQCQFGWDHTPACLMVGLWQGVRLERRSAARLRFPHFRVLSLDPGQAAVSLDAEVECWGEDEGLEVQVRLSLLPEFEHLATQPQHFEIVVPVIDGQARAVWALPKPVMWWPNGYGEPARYRLDVLLCRDHAILDWTSEEVGLRTVRVDRIPDYEEVGCESFTFVVNDVPIFIKGANWVPMDVFNGRASPERYEVWFRLLKEIHGNMLRIWGGGQYEPDSYYQTADRMGILIWHDFMFACARYPDYLPEFWEEVRLEAEYQVKRLRNHPCMAMWCGSNENDWLDDKDYWDDPGHDFPGKKIEHVLLPEIVHRLDPERFYWPSSPYGGNDYNGDQAGDRHNWYTWHASAWRTFGTKPKDIDEFPHPTHAVNYWHLGEDIGRFISEYGMHGSPVLETLKRNIPPEGLAYNSPEMLFRVRNAVIGRGDLMLEAHTGLPECFEEYIDFSQMVQAEGMKYGIEHHRRRKFHCSGTLFWQWNDDWPSITWSVLDYYTFPKPSYFFVKRAYAPVIVSVKRDSDFQYPQGRFSIWGTNDTLEPVRDTLTWTHLTFDGRIRRQESVPIEIPANASVELVLLDKELLSAGPPEREMIWLHSENDLFPDNRYFLVELKDLDRARPEELQIEWQQDGDALIATVSADRHAYFVSLFIPQEGVRYSDNWIDLFPGQSRQMRVWHKDGLTLSPEQVEVRWT